MLANSTHRTEHTWQIKAFVTTAAFTGTRIVVLAVPDPSHATKLTEDMVWGATCNGRGVMVEATGNTDRTASFSIRTATRVLSNSAPPATENYLGYSAATLTVWLLQPPIGLPDSNTELKCTIVGRCKLTCHNPIPGYGLAQLGLGEDALKPHGPIAWQLLRSATYLPDSKTMAESSEPWVKSHTGNIILAGGWYFDFWNHNGKAPIINSGTTNASNGQSAGITIKGEPKSGCVYTCSSPFPPWQNNRGNSVVPKYFAVIRSPATGVCMMIGFATEDQACNQAANRWASIPGGAELCITYSKAPSWGQFHPITANGEMELSFYQVYDAGGSTPVYSTSNPLPRAVLREIEPADMVDYNLDSDFDTDEEEEEEDPMEGPSNQHLTTPVQPSAPPATPTLPNFFQLTPQEIEEQMQQANLWLWNLHKAKAAQQHHQQRHFYPDLSTLTLQTDPPTPKPKTLKQPDKTPSWWDLLKGAIKSRRKSDSD